MAQLVEQRIRNAQVPGSSPGIGSKQAYVPSSKSVFCFLQAELAQLVEHWLPKPRVAGSSPVFRSTLPPYFPSTILSPIPCSIQGNYRQKTGRLTERPCIKALQSIIRLSRLLETDSLPPKPPCPTILQKISINDTLLVANSLENWPKNKLF